MRRALLLSLALVDCASLVGIGDLTVEDASAPEAGCGWPGPDAGLVGYWAFEEQAGTSTTDCSGNGHAAVLIDNANNHDAGWWDAGQRGGAVRVSGDVNGNNFGCMQLQLPESYAVPPSPPFSISAFVRVEPKAFYQRFVVARSQKGTAGQGWAVTMDPDAGTLALKLFAALDGGADYSLSVSGSWLDGAWHHVVVVVPADAGATIAMDDASTTDPTPPPAIKVDQSVGVSLGCRGDGAYPFVGAIDEVRIYDHVLDAGEIAALEQK